MAVVPYADRPLVRSDSFENVQIGKNINEPVAVDPQAANAQATRDAAAAASEAATRCGCGIIQVGVGIGLSAAGHPGSAQVAVVALKGVEEVSVVGSKALTESGFVDGAINRSRGITNSCVIL